MAWPWSYSLLPVDSQHNQEGPPCKCNVPILHKSCTWWSLKHHKSAGLVHWTCMAASWQKTKTKVKSSGCTPSHIHSKCLGEIAWHINGGLHWSSSQVHPASSYAWNLSTIHLLWAHNPTTVKDLKRILANVSLWPAGTVGPNFPPWEVPVLCCPKSLCPKPCKSRVSPWHPAITLKNCWTNQIEELRIHKLPNNGIVTENEKITQYSKTFLLTKVHSLESHIYLSTTLLFTMLNSTSFFIKDIPITAITTSLYKNKHHLQSDESNWYPSPWLLSQLFWRWTLWKCGNLHKPEF